MKKSIAILLAILMAFTIISVAACNTAKTVRVTLYVTPDSSPRVCNHTIGEDDLPIVTNGDLEFIGWYKDKTYNLPFKFDDDIKDGQVLYAKWSDADKVTLTLNLNYQGADNITEQVDKGSTYELPNAKYEGHILDGWFTQPNGGIQWTSSKPITSDLTLYAQWTEVNNGGNQGDDNQGGSNDEPEKVTLTLKLNYQGAQDVSIEVNKDSTCQLPNVKRDGYTLDGWFTQATDGIQWTSSMSITSDLTLYAQWTEVNNGNNNEPEKVTLTLNYNYSGAQVTTNELDKNSTYSLPNATRDGYTFDGWFTQATGGDKKTGSITVSDDLTLYAQWTEVNNGGNDDKVGATVEIDLTGKGGSGTAAVDFTTLTQGGVTITATKGTNTSSSPKYYSESLRLYGGNTMTVSAPSDKSITSIKLTFASGGNSNTISANVGAFTSSTGTWSGSASSVKFTIGGTSGNRRIAALVVDLDGGGATIGNVMENQIYNEATFDDKNLQEKMLTDDAIGLPSKGTYSALVIPVQFVGDAITDEQLNNLNMAFNGTSEQTGWESVKTYYQKASYGNLNLTFDIQPVYEAKQNANYYATYSKDMGDWTKDGSVLILEEALAYYESRLDLTDYDTNGDGCIDAVYLIYSTDINYDDDDSIYWAFVYWYFGDIQYDGLDAYYYLFAGIDFMDESVNGKTPNADKYPPIDGLKLNASTYIHETGHLLGLDDYYDYYPNKGCNEGLGGADMMDYTVGDQNVYSKTMLGWLTPTIVTSTQTITIKSSQEGGYAILVPLNFNNSYFCEYLLIDLYSAQGLNALHASEEDSFLYDGAKYGVRIYHVTSWANDPYNNEMGSFTDYNNSTTDFALIKLVEADGDDNFESSNGYAMPSDLWQEGDSLSDVFPSYKRNDGKTLNFDITIDAVSAQAATITITFDAAE